VISPGARSIAATFVTLGLAYGVWYAYSVFLVALLREFGWSRTLLAGAFSLFTLVHGLVGPLAGSIADRIGPRRLTLAGGVILAGGLALDGAVSRPWHLYAAFGVVTALGVACSGWVPAVVLVQKWFPRRIGTALGLTSAGIGVGIFLVVPFCQWMVDAAGWRWAFRSVGIVVACWMLPATLWLVREPVAGAPRAPALPGSAGAPGDPTPGAAVRTRAFWCLAFAMLSASFVNQMLLVHQVAYLVDHGISALAAASVVGVVGIASVAGKAGGGWFSDTFGRAVTYTLGMSLVVASIGVLGLLALAPGPLTAYAYGALVGVGYSITAPLMPALVNDFFRGRHFGAIFGMLHAANATGGGLGPWVAGRVFDATGGYAPAFVAAVASGALSTAAIWLAGRPGRR
jgi:MFS family permease